ncbi:hypothetical protein COH84_01530 [Neisseria meningitidis]|nr:hypothetical protein COH84_01530 [Neisseria meningitidis]
MTGCRFVGMTWCRFPCGWIRHSRFCGNDGDRVAVIVDEQKPVRRCLASAQRERFSKVLKHQVNRFRTICTVCGFVALS